MNHTVQSTSNSPVTTIVGTKKRKLHQNLVKNFNVEISVPASQTTQTSINDVSEESSSAKSPKMEPIEPEVIINVDENSTPSVSLPSVQLPVPKTIDRELVIAYHIADAKSKQEAFSMLLRDLSHARFQTEIQLNRLNRGIVLLHDALHERDKEIIALRHNSELRLNSIISSIHHLITSMSQRDKSLYKNLMSPN